MFKKGEKLEKGKRKTAVVTLKANSFQSMVKQVLWKWKTFPF